MSDVEYMNYVPCGAHEYIPTRPKLVNVFSKKVTFHGVAEGGAFPFPAGPQTHSRMKFRV